MTAGGKAQPFDRWNDDVQSLTVGNSGDLYGFSVSIGAFRPHALSVGGVRYFLANIATNAVAMVFVDGAGADTQASDWLALSITVQDYSANPVVLPWDGPNSRYLATNAPFAAYVAANEGASLRVTIRG